jgi:hypothetical protein
MTEPNLEFNEWCGRWLTLAAFTGTRLPDEEARINAVVELWNHPIPPGWKRGSDKQLLESDRRYRRANTKSKRGEHAIEDELLSPSPTDAPANSLGFRLVDGVNAVPLTRDAAGGRKGNVEADMLLLVTDERDHRLQLVEVKDSSNHAWYAVIENFRALKLFLESDVPQRLFHERRPELKLPEALPVTAITLAPPGFYASRGRRTESVAPAQRLLERMRAECAVDAVIATWDPSARLIHPL